MVLISLAMVPVNNYKWRSDVHNDITQPQQNNIENVFLKKPSNILMPDVYFIILDSYGGRNTLNTLYGDGTNKVFIESLKKKGFFISTESYSNYDNTLPSVAATLNMKYINDIFLGNFTEEQRYSSMSEMIDNSEVARTFKNYGYMVYLLNSKSKSNEIDFTDKLIETTYYNYWWKRQSYRRHVLSTFENFSALIEKPGPKFVYAHFDIPHSPFVFDADCKAIDTRFSDKKLDGSEKPNRYYIDQLYCSNKLIEPLLDKILTKPGAPPLVILSGDHGPPIGVAGVPSAPVINRLGILSAFYVPDYIKNKLHASISPVNTFRWFFVELSG